MVISFRSRNYWLLPLVVMACHASSAKADSPETERAQQIKEALASAPKPPERLKALTVLLLADEKDHGPAGNGAHDYPLWQKRWALLLGGKDASTEKQVNLVGPPADDLAQFQGSPGVKVLAGLGPDARDRRVCAPGCPCP